MALYLPSTSSRQHPESRRRHPVFDQRTRRLLPFIERIFADGGYQGPTATAAAARTGTWAIDIVKRPDTAIGFEIVPKRWIVGRTIAWINRSPSSRERFRAIRQNRRSLAALDQIKSLPLKSKLLGSTLRLFATSLSFVDDFDESDARN